MDDGPENFHGDNAPSKPLRTQIKEKLTPEQLALTKNYTDEDWAWTEGAWGSMGEVKFLRDFVYLHNQLPLVRDF